MAVLTFGSMTMINEIHVYPLPGVCNYFVTAYQFDSSCYKYLKITKDKLIDITKQLCLQNEVMPSARNGENRWRRGDEGGRREIGFFNFYKFVKVIIDCRFDHGDYGDFLAVMEGGTGLHRVQCKGFFM